MDLFLWRNFFQVSFHVNELPSTRHRHAEQRQDGRNGVEKFKFNLAHFLLQGDFQTKIKLFFHEMMLQRSEGLPEDAVLDSAPSLSHIEDMRLKNDRNSGIQARFCARFGLQFSECTICQVMMSLLHLVNGCVLCLQ